MSHVVIDWVGFAIGIIIAIGLAFGYFKNIWKLICGLRASDWSFKLGLRGLGVFVPVIGVIMGFV